MKNSTISIIKPVYLYGSKIMSEKEFCQDCGQRRNCGDIYRQLGRAEGPSVALKVVEAFVLPIVVFIAGLAVFEKILGGTITTKGLRTAFSALAALAVAFVCVLIIKVINIQAGKKRTNSK